MCAERRSPALDFKRVEFASYLHERVPRVVPSAPAAEDVERLAAWRSSAYLSEEKFSVRLRSTGRRADEFAALLGDGEFSVPPEATSWADELERLLSRPRTNAPTGVTAKLYGVRFERIPFSSLIEPLLDGYAEALDRQASQDPAITGSGIPLDVVREGLLQALADRLVDVCGRTLILELNVARIRGRLNGADAEARYDSYDEELLRDPAYLEELFSEYPVLGRALVECGRAWQSYALELLGRLAQDAGRLRESGFLHRDLSELTEITADLGDSHAHGRTVARLTFQDGSRLIYKPRPVEPEQAYAEVADAVRESGAPCARAGRTLARGEYGWCEFVERQPCEDERAIREFYRKAGGTLAVLLFLGAGDVHMENVIPSGTDMVPVDLETLLQPTSLNVASKTAHEKAMDILEQSVLGIGMLPARVFGKAQGKGVDVSALGGGVPQEAPMQVPRVVDAFTDLMRIEPRTGMMQSVGNRPHTREAEYGPDEYAAEITGGFRAAYRAISDNREVFAGLLRGFADHPVRYLARPTRRYGLFLTESHHPNYLRDGRDRDRLLEKLWTVIEGREDMVPLVESERVQLLRGDIPVFHSRPGSTELFSGPSKVASDFFLGSSLDSLMGRFEMYGTQHFEAQLRIVNDTLGAYRAQQSSWKGTKPSEGEPSAEHSGEELLALNRKYMDGLVETAVYGADDDCTWIGVRLNGLEEDAFDYRATGTSVYDGLGGMALAFSQAAVVHGSDTYMDMARRCTTPVIRHLQDVERNGLSQPVGAYSGIGGSLYVLDLMARVTGDYRYHDHLRAALPSVLRSAKNETYHELVAGLAGCMSVASGLYRSLADPSLRELAAVCAERLHDGAVREGEALSWPVEEGGTALTGFSHGAAGIGWALLEAADVLGEKQFRQDALGAFEFERTRFMPEHGTWEDLREEEVTGRAEGRFMARWCHGAGGIGLARMLSARHLEDDPRILDEARVALRALDGTGFGATHCLCHGDFGNLEVLELAESVLPEEEASQWRSVRLKRAREAVTTLVGRGPVCGVAPGVEMSGLMLGTAGVAMGLLRLARPGRIPSVLWLESPRTA